MEKDARYFIVGISVIVAFVALIGFTIWLIGAPKSEEQKIYTVYFTDPVSGLKEGASVQYRGVDVGNILDIRLSKTREDLIKVNITIDKETPIGSSTTATLAMLGITGLVYMELTTEAGEYEPPERIEGEPYPVLKGNGTQLAKILQDIPQITKQISELGDKLNKFFDEENLNKLTQTLENTEKLSRDLNGLLTPENINNANLTLENFSSASTDIKDISARFEKTADEIDNAVESLNDMISNNKENVNRFTREGLNQITETSREAKKAVKAIRKITEELSQDPSQIIFKPQPRGVEIPE